MNQNKLKYNISLILCFLLLVSISDRLLSQEIKENDVKNLISGSESMLNNVVNQEAGDYASREISVIQEYISKSKDLLKAKKYSEAYYEIMIGVEYFRVIESKRLLKKASGAEKDSGK